MWIRLSSAVLSALAAAPLWAWGPNGHQTVGAIADGVLAGTPAGRKVKTLLGGQSLQRSGLAGRPSFRWRPCSVQLVRFGPRYPQAEMISASREKSPGRDTLHK